MSELKDNNIDIDIDIDIDINKQKRIKKLEEHLLSSKNLHEIQILKEQTLKDAHIYCVIHSISSQQYGPLLEKYIRTKFNYDKNKSSDCIGDCSKDNKNVEIKVSLGGKKHNKFNFVQIRPSHDCDIYILTAYNLSLDNLHNEGELYIFKIPKKDLKNIIVLYGGYAHGTIKEYGKISIDTINHKNNNKEYAIRPSIGSNCWKELLQFRIYENSL
jgi:hypothetical protein